MAVTRYGVEIDESSMQRVRDLLYSARNGANKAALRAVNHGTRQGRKALVDGIAQKAALKKADIRKHTSFYLASTGTLGNPEGRIWIKGRPLSLLMYGAKPLGKGGISFRIWRDGKREKYRHAFLGTLMKSRYSGVFEVNIKSPEYDPKSQTPWRRKEGPGVPTIYEQTPGLAQRAHTVAADAMLKELDRQIGLLFRGFYD